MEEVKNNRISPLLRCEILKYSHEFHMVIAKKRAPLARIG
jgi:hypothetical protein